MTGNKVFNVIIGTVTGGASLGTSTTAPVTIFDNESGTYGSGSVKLAKATANVSKSTGYIDISVQRVGSAAGTVTVTYNTTPLTASASIDYTSVNGTLTFLPGESTKVVRVPIIKNTGSSNAGKTFSFDLLGTSSNATLNTPTSETVTIDN